MLRSIFQRPKKQRKTQKVRACGLDGKFAIVMENLVPLEYCRKSRKCAEERGYEEAPVNVGRGRQMILSDFRNSERSVFDDPVAAEEIWQMILQALSDLDDKQQQELGIRYLFRPYPRWLAVGLNERLRILKYSPGQYF